MKWLLAGILVLFLAGSLYAQGGLLPPPQTEPPPDPGRQRIRRPKTSPPKQDSPEIASEQTFASQSITQNTELHAWLERMTAKRRLVRVIPVKDSRSLFSFGKEGTGGDDFPYCPTTPIAEPLSESDIQQRIEYIEADRAYRVMKFLGLHKLEENSYVLVFYCVKK